MKLHTSRVFRTLKCSPLLLLLMLILLLRSNSNRSGTAELSGCARGCISRRVLLTMANQSVSNHFPSNRTLMQSQSAPRKSQFPTDIFTPAQRRHGALLLHVLGVAYMFVALALVCDEYFVPSLEVICQRLGISEDVAGATFMAAGGSAPELYTNIIGVFVAQNDVGITTIVGSAVFNILFVIAMCGLLSRTVLHLSWWPLFRDVSFYSGALLLLAGILSDQQVTWWEATSLLLLYLLYCLFMKFNARLEHCTCRQLARFSIGRVHSSDHLMTTAHPEGTSRAARLQSGNFRQGLLHLMMHSLDPLSENTMDNQATQLQAVASLKMLLESRASTETMTRVSTINQAATRDENCINNNDDSFGSPDCVTSISVARSGTTGNNEADSSADQLSSQQYQSPAPATATVAAAAAAAAAADDDDDDDDVWGEDRPTNLSWPPLLSARVLFVLTAPILFMLSAILPDCKTARGRNHYVLAFIGSVLWIGVFSYLMVWWAIVIAETVFIPPEVVGLAVLAAGTSIPDLITSVIVARKGFGDMAVSSSIGSNIFDVCVGLPLPWLLSSLVQWLKQLTGVGGLPGAVGGVVVSGLTCMVLLLFVVLLTIVICLMCSNWHLHKSLALVMILLYFAFLTFALLLELSVVKCLF